MFTETVSAVTDTASADEINGRSIYSIGLSARCAIINIATQELSKMVRPSIMFK